MHHDRMDDRNRGLGPVIQRIIRRTASELQIRRDPVRYFRRRGFQIGSRCRLIGATYGMLGTEPTLVTIGDHVTVSVGVLFITHDGGVWVMRDEVGPVDVFGPIKVGDGAFVGARAVLLPGITIGSRSIVGAGAVVARSVPDDVVVAGCPARVVSTTADYRDRLRPYFHQTANLPASAKHEYLRTVDPLALMHRATLPLRGPDPPQG